MSDTAETSPDGRVARDVARLVLSLTDKCDVLQQRSTVEAESRAATAGRLIGVLGEGFMRHERGDQLRLARPHSSNGDELHEAALAWASLSAWWESKVVPCLDRLDDRLRNTRWFEEHPAARAYAELTDGGLAGRSPVAVAASWCGDAASKPRRLTDDEFAHLEAVHAGLHALLMANPSPLTEAAKECVHSLRQVARAFADTCEEAGVAFRCAPVEAPVQVELPSNFLRLLVTTLVDNAKEYSAAAPTLRLDYDLHVGGDRVRAIALTSLGSSDPETARPAGKAGPGGLTELRDKALRGVRVDGEQTPEGFRVTITVEDP